MQQLFAATTGKEYSQKENLKEMGDVSSGMASTVIQVYLQAVLDSFIHPSIQVVKIKVDIKNTN